MDTQSLYYFVEATKDMHFTKTANRLYISQQTLSNHIKRLEQELGTTLFQREPKITLTYAGTLTLQCAKQLLQNMDNLAIQLQDIRDEKRGVLKIGAGSNRASLFLPDVISEFSKHYPNIQIQVVDNISAVLEQKVDAGELDFAVVLVTQDTNRPYLNLIEDAVCLCVSEQLLRKYYNSEADILKIRAVHGANLQDFARMPFCIPHNRLGDQLRAYFKETGCHINENITTVSGNLAIYLCLQGISASFSTQFNLNNYIRIFGNNINIFPISYHGKQLKRQFALIRPQNRYLSSYATLFQELTLQYFNDLQQKDFVRVVSA